MDKRETAYITLHAFYEYANDFQKNKYVDIEDLKNLKNIYSKKELMVLKKAKNIFELIKNDELPNIERVKVNEYFHKSIDCPSLYNDFQLKESTIDNTGCLKHESSKIENLKEEIKDLINHIKHNVEFNNIRAYFNCTSLLFIDEKDLSSETNKDLLKKLNDLKTELVSFHLDFKCKLRYKIIDYYFQTILGRDLTEYETLKFKLVPCICYNDHIPTLDSILDPNSEHYIPNLNLTPEEIEEFKKYFIFKGKN